MSRTTGTYINPQKFLIGAKFTTLCSSGQASSPASVNSNTPTTLYCPNYCAEVVLLPAQDMRLSEYSDVHTYTLLKQNTEYTIGVGGMDALYAQMDSSPGYVYFRWILVT